MEDLSLHQGTARGLQWSKVAPVEWLERLARALAEVISETRAWAPLILFFGSFVEYVFPLFPGDLLVVLGAWYAVHGGLSWPATFAAVMLGAVAGAWVDYRIGAWLGPKMEAGAHHRGRLSLARLAWVEAGYRRYGAFFILANRFLPGVRAFLFIGAGAVGLPLRRVLLFGAISAALWNACLLLAGAYLAKNLDGLIALVGRYVAVAWALVGVGVLALTVKLIASRRRTL
jgi:membrane-associated protein